MSKIQHIKQNLVKKYPLLARLQLILYRFKPYPAKFQSYYRYNGWNNAESVSGPGSTLHATENLRSALPSIFDQYHVHSMIDIPCGDFHWMKEVDLTGIDYQGFDIVRELTLENQRRYVRHNICFRQVDLMKDPLPTADLILCRDCLFHYSFRNINLALQNIRRSQSLYLLTTTFPRLERNEEILSDGLFRPINLQLPPFSFPAPLSIINEENGVRDGKCIALWRISDLR